MTHLVAQVLEELRDDHRNMALMLDLLEREVGYIQDGAEADYELLSDIMSYMTVYADAVHHPKEDLIYDILRSAGAEFDSGLDSVADDHSEIAKLSQVLRRDIEAIVAGAAVTRDRVIADTLDYAQHLRRHMAWEEDDLFQRADELVRQSNSVSVDASRLNAVDPVFSQSPQAGFDNLLRSIQEAAEESRL